MLIDVKVLMGQKKKWIYTTILQELHITKQLQRELSKLF